MHLSPEPTMYSVLYIPNIIKICPPHHYLIRLLAPIHQVSFGVLEAASYNTDKKIAVYRASKKQLKASESSGL